MLIGNQFGSLDRQPGIISDVAALFLTCASLISQDTQGKTGHSSVLPLAKFTVLP